MHKKPKTKNAPADAQNSRKPGPSKQQHVIPLSHSIDAAVYDTIHSTVLELLPNSPQRYRQEMAECFMTEFMIRESKSVSRFIRRCLLDCEVDEFSHELKTKPNPADELLARVKSTVALPENSALISAVEDLLRDGSMLASRHGLNAHQLFAAGQLDRIMKNHPSWLRFRKFSSKEQREARHWVISAHSWSRFFPRKEDPATNTKTNPSEQPGD